MLLEKGWRGDSKRCGSRSAARRGRGAACGPPSTTAGRSGRERSRRRVPPASIWSGLLASGAGERPGGRGGSGGLLADLDPFELGVGHNELPNLFGLAVLLVLPDLEEPG